MKTEAIIRKEGNKWVLYSHKGKRLGVFTSREQALKRERQINFFKHQKGSLEQVISVLIHFGTEFEPNDFSGKTIAEVLAISADTTVQTVIVSKKCAKTRDQASKKARSFGPVRTIRETPESYRFRQRPPEDFVSDSFKTKAVNKCVTIVIGKLKGQD